MITRAEFDELYPGYFTLKPEEEDDFLSSIIVEHYEDHDEIYLKENSPHRYSVELVRLLSLFLEEEL